MLLRGFNPNICRLSLPVPVVQQNFTLCKRTVVVIGRLLNRQPHSGKVSLLPTYNIYIYIYLERREVERESDSVIDRYIDSRYLKVAN